MVFLDALETVPLGFKAAAGVSAAQDYAARSSGEDSTCRAHNHEGERGGELVPNL